MTYLLGTTTDKVGWYVFDPNNLEAGYTVIDQLDLKKTPLAGDKKTAKYWAQGLGLKTWKYFRC